MSERVSWLVLMSLVVVIIGYLLGWVVPTRVLAAPQQGIDITVNDIVASGLDHPVQATHAGDGSDRLFVVEQPGTIRIVSQGVVLPQPFLDVTSLVVYGGERGLLGLAFHPDYGTNGLFYLNYTRSGDGALVVARYRVSDGDPNRADESSGVVLLTVEQPYANHNGGQLLFGPHDGYLYIGLGDGGSGGDPLDSGQDISTLLGAMLRLDVDGGSPYAIPADNPFVGLTGRDEIWAFGLRNPWRFSFDRANGDLYIGDVGQNLWEEIDYQAAGTDGGVNFGWRCREGAHDYNMSGDCLAADLVDPIAEYNHSEGRSVTGGFVYRGLAYPALQGRYFYADYVEGKIWSVIKTGSSPDTWSAPDLELDTSLRISSFGEDEQGELYVTDYTGGTIRRVADANAPVPDLTTSIKTVSVPSADPLEVVTYTVAVVNGGGPADVTVRLTDTLPAGVVYVPGSLQATAGIGEDSGLPLLTWEGSLQSGPRITLTYRVTATGLVTGSLVNRVRVSAESLPALELSASLFVPRTVLTSTVDDFFLPGTQPLGLDMPFPPALDCDTCHTEAIYDRWRGSVMSQSARDPLLWAALAVANVDAPGSGEYCIRCHVAKGWFAGRSESADGTSLLPEDTDDGVTCTLCHRQVDPQASTMDEAAAIDAAIRAELATPVPLGYVGSGAIIVDPLDRRRGPFSFNLSLPYHTAYQTDLLRQTGDAVTRSRLCGSCHNVDNPLLSWDGDRGQFWLNEPGAPAPDLATDELFPIERTFDEWLLSDFARGGVYSPRFAGAKPDGVVRACQDCHLERSTGIAADQAFDPVDRDCLLTGCLPQHVLAGGNAWLAELLTEPTWRLEAASERVYLEHTALQAEQMLRNAASLTVTLEVSGTVKMARVRVINHSGHKLPTGYPEGRQVWLHLQGFDESGQLVYESGAYDWQENRLVRDDDAKIYEVKQGITPELATVLREAPGASFHFVLNNEVVKDNRIPPQGYQVALFRQPGLQPVGAVYADGQHWDDTSYVVPLETAGLQVTLYYQTASREYVEFLGDRGGVDGQSLRSMWTRSPSPPVIMARAWLPDYSVYLPLVTRYP